MNELKTGNLKYKWLWMTILPAIACWLLLSFLLWNDDSGKIIFSIGFIAVFVLILLFRPEWPWIIMAFFIPLSISTPLVGEAHRIAFPGEAMAILMLGITGAMWLMYPDNLQRLLSHPLSVTIFIWVTIVWLSALFTSTMTLVSVKSATIHLLYILTFYLAGAWITERFPGLSNKIFLASAISVSLITLFIVVKFINWNFSPMYAPLMPQPFFNDHTLYGTVAFMLLPFSFVFAFKGNHWDLSGNSKSLYWITTFFLLVAVTISFSRGAWISLIGGSVITALLWAGWRFIHYAILLAIISIFIVWQYERFERAFLQVPQVTEYTVAETYRNPDIADPEHELQIRVSNQERINRWQAAIGMFREKPITGFGPGTYQFQYFAYQKHEYKTPISVLVYGPEETGKGGTVHSEFLMALSETGLPGFLAFCVMFLTIFYYISKVFNSSELKSRYYISAVCFGISAFVIHGFLNNFLGTVEVGFLFWFTVGQLLRLAVPFKSHTS